MQIQPGLPSNHPVSGNVPLLPKPSSNEKEWTILLYLNGNNNIERDVLTGFLTTEEVSEHERMNVLAQLGRSPQSIAHNGYTDNVDGDWDGVRRYEMRKGLPELYPKKVYTSLGEHDGKIDSRVVADLGKQDMSNKENLANFLRWGMKNYPAKHYMVVLAGHGAGFLGGLPDYKSRKHMSLQDMNDAFRQVEKETGKKPDVLVMDACLMGQAEVAGQIKDAAKFYVASEDENWNCLPLQKTLQNAHEKWNNGAEVSTEDMVGYIIKESGAHRDVPTISAIKLEKMDKLVDGVKLLADTLLNSNTDPAVIRDVIDHTTHFAGEDHKVKPYTDYRDLKDFCQNLFFDPRILDRNIKNAAYKVIKSMGDDFVLSENHAQKFDANGRKRVFGISIYLPTSGFDYNRWGMVFPHDTNKYEYEGIYRNLDFVKKTGWDRVIDKFAIKNGNETRGASVIDSLIKSSGE